MSSWLPWSSSSASSTSEGVQPEVETRISSSRVCRRRRAIGFAPTAAHSTPWNSVECERCMWIMLNAKPQVEASHEFIAAQRLPMVISPRVDTTHHRAREHQDLLRFQRQLYQLQLPSYELPRKQERPAHSRCHGFRHAHRTHAIGHLAVYQYKNGRGARLPAGEPRPAHVSEPRSVRRGAHRNRVAQPGARRQHCDMPSVSDIDAERDRAWVAAATSKRSATFTAQHLFRFVKWQRLKTFLVEASRPEAMPRCQTTITENSTQRMWDWPHIMPQRFGVDPNALG